MTEQGTSRGDKPRGARRSAGPGEQRAATANRPRHALPNGHRARRWALRGLVGLLALVLVATGLLIWRATSSLSAIPRKTGYMPTATDRPVAPKGPVSFLLLGADKRDWDPSDPGRSDTMMLVYVPENRRHVYVISLPRDLWVPIHDDVYDKINAAYFKGGPALSVQTVEDMFNVGLNHTGVIDFDGFMKLIDVLGGVEVYNPEESKSELGYTFPKGNITLKGEYGLAYVRQRHELLHGDLDRTARQRAVVKAIVAKAISGGVLTNPAKLEAMVNQVSQCVSVDSSLTDGTVLGLALAMKLSSSDDVRTFMMPLADDDTTPDGQSIQVPDLTIVSELGHALATDTLDAYWAKHKDDPLYTFNRPYPRGSMPVGPSPKPNSTQTPSPGASATSSTKR